MEGFLRYNILNFCAQALLATFTFLTSVLTARWLGPLNNGVYNLAILIATLSIQFTNLGIVASNVYFTGNRRFSLSDIIGNSLTLSVGLALLTIFILLGLLQTEGFRVFLKNNSLTVFQFGVVALTVPMSTCLLFFNSVLLGQGRIAAYNVINIARIFLQLFWLSVLVALLQLGLGGAICSYFLAIGGALLLSAWLIRQTTHFCFTLNLPLLRASLNYGVKAYIGNLMQFLSYRLNIFFVAYFLGAEAVGHYAVALTVAEGLWLIAGSVGQVLFPYVSAMGEEEANRLTPKATRYTLFLVFLIATSLAVLARPLINLIFGGVYLPALPALLWLLPGVVLLSIPKILSQDLAGRGHPELGAISAFFAFVVSLPLNWFLIPLWGLTGAAISSTVGYAAAAGVVVVAFCRLSGISWLETLVTKPSDFHLYVRLMLQFLRVWSRG
jgi:O-antigen/teichoic acid export membrane protein